MSDEEMKFGLEGIEQSQGYEPMPMADPAPSSDDLPTDAIMTEAELAHASRPVEADWGHAVERDYFDNQTGAETPKNQTVSKEQAAHDLTQAREAELKQIENEAREALARALDGQPDQPQPEIDQPQPESFPDEDAARAHHDAAWAEADKAIERVLQEPLVAERIQQSLDQVRQEASAKAEQTSRLAEAMQQHYQNATNTLVAEATSLMAAFAPELQGLKTPQEVAAALRVLAQTQPQKAEAISQLASRAQNLFAAQQRQQAERQQGEALQREYEMQQFAATEEKKFEAAVANESPETVRAVRENVFNVAERHYGVPKQTLQALYSGEQQISSAALMRSSAFQQMVFDAVRFRLGQQSLRDHAVRPVASVQRPGVATGAPTQESDYSALERSLRGRDLTAKQAADLLIAHRGRR